MKEELNKLENWTVTSKHIERTIIFKDFKEAISKMVEISFECEKFNHHPEWFNVYNKLHIKLTTHDSDGITIKDIELAKAIDNIV